MDENSILFEKNSDGSCKAPNTSVTRKREPVLTSDFGCSKFQIEEIAPQVSMQCSAFVCLVTYNNRNRWNSLFQQNMHCVVLLCTYLVNRLRKRNVLQAVGFEPRSGTNTILAMQNIIN